MEDNLFIFSFNTNMKYTKKFISYLGITLLLFILFDICIGSFFTRLHCYNYSKNSKGFITEYLINDIRNEALIIGASTAQHHYDSKMMSDSLELDVFNAGIDGSFFLHQVCILNGILDRYTPKLIIWNISPYDLTDQLLKLEIERFNQLFPFYEKKKICREVMNKYEPSLKYKLLFNSYRFNSKLLSEIRSYLKPQSNNDYDYQPLEVDGYKYPSIRNGKIVSAKFEKYNYHLIRKIIDTCFQKKINLVFCISPRLTLDKRYKETKSYQTLLALLKEKSISFLDFYHEDSFMNDSTLFKDNNHLNKRGAEKYTKKIINRLYNIIKK